MSFDWIEISVGDIIRKAHIDELRDNIDYIKDNEACITYKNGVLNGHHSNEDTGEYTTYESTNYSGNDGTHRVHEYSGQNNTYQDGAKAGVYSSAKGTHKDGEYGTVEGIHNSGQHSYN